MVAYTAISDKPLELICVKMATKVSCHKTVITQSLLKNSKCDVVVAEVFIMHTLNVTHCKSLNQVVFSKFDQKCYNLVLEDGG